ncbi:MAG: P-loop NTPase [Verrucomicrobiota bacterium]
MATIFIAHENQGTAKLISDAALSQGHQVLGVVYTAADVEKQAHQAEIAILSVNLPDVDLFSVIPTVQSNNPAISIVPTLNGTEGGEIWQQILAYELRDALVSPNNMDSVVEVINKAILHMEGAAGGEHSADGSHQDSYVITVASSRGGVGKTMFAVNLALAMTQLQAKLTLLDYSMSSGDFFTVLDQVPRNTMVDAISQGMGMDDILLQNIMSEHPSGFNYLACPNDDFDFYGFDYDSSAALIEASRTIAPFTVIDTGVYDLPPTNAAVEQADLVYFLTNRDLSRLMSLQKLIKSYQERDIPAEKFKVIVNMAEWGTEITEEEIEELLEHPVTAYLPSIPIEATFSINSGKPMTQANSDLPIISVIRKLAEYTLQRWEV